MIRVIIAVLFITGLFSANAKALDKGDFKLVTPKAPQRQKLSDRIAQLEEKRLPGSTYKDSAGNFKKVAEDGGNDWSWDGINWYRIVENPLATTCVDGNCRIR